MKKDYNQIEQQLDFGIVFEKFPNVYWFSLSNNHLYGGINFTTFHSSVEHFDLAFNDYSSSLYLNGSDDYLDFTPLLENLDPTRFSGNIFVDVTMQCDPSIYCNHTAYVPTDRKTDVCDGAQDCTNQCGVCENPCKSEFLGINNSTGDSYQLCEIFKNVDGILWYYWDDEDYCDDETQYNLETFNNIKIECVWTADLDVSDGENPRFYITAIELLGENEFSGTLDTSSIYFRMPSRLKTFNVSNQGLYGNFTIPEIYNISELEFGAFEKPSSIQYLDISNNEFEGDFHVYQMTTMLYLDVSNNSFATLNFDYAFDFGDQYSGLQVFDLSHNQFSNNVSHVMRLFALSVVNVLFIIFCRNTKALCKDKHCSFVVFFVFYAAILLNIWI